MTTERDCDNLSKRHREHIESSIRLTREKHGIYQDKDVVKIFLMAIGAYCLYCAFLFAVQRQIIFPRHMIDPAGWPVVKPPAREVIWLDTAVG